MEGLATHLPVLKPETCADCAGRCCRTFDINAIKRSDVDRLAQAIGHASAEAIVSWDPGGEYGNFILKTSRNPVTGDVDLACPLHVDGNCSVHDHRPDTCRQFKMGGPRCEKLKEWKA